MADHKKILDDLMPDKIVRMIQTQLLKQAMRNKPGGDMIDHEKILDELSAEVKKVLTPGEDALTELRARITGLEKDLCDHIKSHM